MTHPLDDILGTILGLYAQGQFPMAHPDGAIYLYDPDPRGIIPLDDGALRVTRSLRQRVRSGRFRITTDQAFGEVIRACAEPRPAPADDDEAEASGAEASEAEDCTWINEDIIQIYEALHHAGHAHSIEAWLDPPGDEASDHSTAKPTLVGGLYGVHLQGLFAGESMFSRPSLGGTDASKVCLVHLWHHLRARGFTLLDTQFTTPHLERLGAIEISREAYKERLTGALAFETTWEPFSPARQPC